MGSIPTFGSIFTLLCGFNKLLNDLALPKIISELKIPELSAAKVLFDNININTPVGEIIWIYFKKKEIMFLALLSRIVLITSFVYLVGISGDRETFLSP